MPVIIGGSRISVDEDSSLLGYYAIQIGKYLLIFWRTVLSQLPG